MTCSRASLLRASSADGRGFGLVGGGGCSRPFSIIPGLYACVSCLTLLYSRLLPSDFILWWPRLGGLPDASEGG